MRRVLFDPRRALTFAAVVLAIAGWGGGVSAQVTPAAAPLGGIRGLAAASGVHALYNPKGLLPTGAVLDFGSPDALTTLSTGPLAFARAGVADPGDLLANPDALLSQLSKSYPAGTIPSWPLRISASSSLGEPTAESNPGPGLNARVAAHSDGSEAQASMPGVDAPAIATFGSAVSNTSTHTDGASVVVKAHSQILGFKLLNVLSVDSIVSDLTATSDATLAKVEGKTTITGATVMGHKVTIDSDGIHAKGKGLPDLNKALAAAGISVYIADPVTAVSGSAGQRDASGLRVEMVLSAQSYPAINHLFDLLPPLDAPVPGAPGVEDLIAAARAHHTVGLQLAPATVSVDARAAAPLFDAPVPPDTSGDDLPSFVSGLDESLTTPLTPGVALPSTPTTPAASTRPTPRFPFGRGLGGLLLLALLIQPLLGYRLATASSSLLAAGAAPDCTEDEP